ncbi:MAG: MFS transporter [Sulfolobales archaeon]
MPRTSTIFKVNPWLILTLCFLINFMLGFKHVWSVLVPYVEVDLKISRALVVLPFSLMSIVNVVGFSTIDYVKSRLGLKLTLTLTTVSTGLGLILTSISQDIVMLTISYAFIYGIGQALGYVLAVTLGVKWFYRTRRGLAAGLTSGGYSLGTLVLAPITSYLVSCFGWRLTTLAIATASVIVMSVATVVLAEPQDEVVSSRTYTPLDILKTKTFYMAWSMIFLTSLIDGFAASHLTPFVMEYVGVGVLIASTAVSVYSLVNFLTRVVIGEVAERIGIYRILMIVYIISTLNIALLPTYRFLPLTYLGSSLIGLIHGTNVALIPLIAARMWGTKYLGSNYGLLLTSATMSMLAGPIIGGLSHDLTGNYDLSLTILTIASATGIPLLYMIRKELTQG